MRTLLLRGMLAGLAGGVLYALFAYLFGEPSVDSAIAYEEQAAAAAPARWTARSPSSAARCRARSA